MNVTILVQTQYMENYGDESQPHWKMKGGDDYLFTTFVKDNEFFDKKLQMVVDLISPYIEYRNAFTEEYIIGWSVVESNYQTDSERMQLEYDGEVLYPAKRYDVDEFLAMQQKETA